MNLWIRQFLLELKCMLNDEENSESKKLTLMNYAKKVYGDFDTGQNPQIYNNYNIWEKNNNL